MTVHTPDKLNKKVIPPSSRSIIIIVIIISMILVVATVVYFHIEMESDDWEDGTQVIHDYEYTYAVRIQNVTGPYTVVLPVPLLHDGEVLPEIDFEGLVPGRCAMAPTPKGLGLRVWGYSTVDSELHGTIGDLRNSESVNRGLPFLSMIEGDVGNTSAPSMRGNLWVSSDVEGLQISIIVDYKSKREWVTWSGDTTFRDGIGWRQEVNCNTSIGWELYELDVHCTCVT